MYSRNTLFWEGETDDKSPHLIYDVSVFVLLPPGKSVAQAKVASFARLW
jgi:hypothetical protein